TPGTITALPLELIVGGMAARQVWRKRDVAIYERGSGLELIFIAEESPATFSDGRTLPARERYPRTTQWGNAGWSFDAWRLPYLIKFGETLAGMKEGQRKLVAACMRDNRLWRKHLGPLRNPGNVTPDAHISYACAFSRSDA